MFTIDDTLKNPSIPVTIRFTPVLHKWLSETAVKEQVSLNQLVLLCCKYAKEEYIEAAISETEEAPQ
ncbi:toxin-antitoxin system HicB family antitoxin [Thomasclavelia cocleata]|jgi:predicted HicB family RNase H-like nuclease|uniref:toxin-antitoxin system HicB family antitoxin n=1 Tax=Thomasclavelia cocleata TaxID=69824 RepID=UPI002557EE9C|nr:toxin-antitoxin system HicB family antitoxin [Thomasclavelia cocleata]